MTLGKATVQGYTTLTLGGTTFSLVYQGHERIFMLLTTGDLITRQISSCNGTAATIVSPWDRAIAPHYVAMFGKLILCRSIRTSLRCSMTRPRLTTVNLRQGTGEGVYRAGRSQQRRRGRLLLMSLATNEQLQQQADTAEVYTVVVGGSTYTFTTYYKSLTINSVTYPAIPARGAA